MAYALEALVQILEQDQHHANLACNPQIESLLEKARSLRDFCVELSFPKTHPKLADLESRIKDVVYEAEDLIESHIRDQVLSVLKDDTSELDLKNFMEEFDSIKEEILNTQAHPTEDFVRADPEPGCSATAGSCNGVSDPGPNSNMVGLTEDFHQLLDHLVGQGPGLQIIPIVGMGGIGKTTLARQLFYDQNTVKCFHKRVWITISQESGVRDTLLAILGCLTNLTDEMCQLDDDQLGKIIRMLLTDQRYLIVVDDVWDLDTWDKIWGVCPGNENCSRIILTTRVSTCYATCSSNHYQMRFMNGSESWELLCSEVFGEESFPPELEKVGKMIAERCQGLPLAIISMAKLLSRIEKKLEHWEHFVMIANSLEVHLDSEVDILSKSYSHLPCSLKPCFLYVGAFLGDHEIRVSRIVNLWIAEGFVSGQNLEDTAEEYLKALSDENLLLACKKEPNGRIRTFKIHSLLRKLCEKKAFEEKFLWFKHLEDNRVPEDKYQLRRVSMHSLVQPTNTMELASFVRSLLCLGPYSQRLAPFFLGLTLLRVLDVFQVEFFQFPKEIVELVLLRYLSFSCHSNLPSSISRLRNLQTIVIRRFPSFREFSLPFELWELTQLRHIKCKETCIWYFPDNGAPQENLQTLSNIQVFVVTDSLLDNMPNLRKLGLFCNKLVQSVIHLDRLSKLEKLKCSSNLSQATHNFLSYLTFPPSLRKLTLVLCKIPCGFMETVGSLPNLEQLKLRKCAFLVIGNKPTEVALEMEDPEEETEPTWEQVEDHDQFSALISLQMEDLNLVHWKANEIHFPKLKHLIIRGCSSLRELPAGIAERSSIKLIEVDEYCSPSVIASAKDKQKKPIDLEEDILQVDIAESQGSLLERPTIKESVVALQLSGENDPSGGGVKSLFELDCVPLWGSASIGGRRPEMEDAVLAAPNFMKIPVHMFINHEIDQTLSCLSHFFGVYDGHGGLQVANYCRDRIHLALEEEFKKVEDDLVKGSARDTWKLKWEKVFTSCFRKVDDEVGGKVSRKVIEGNGACSYTKEPVAPETVGSTAVVAVMSSSHIIVANCGDSRAVLYSGKEAIALSVDHKPEREDEYARIEAVGGKIIQWNGHRVFGVLATSRSIGDRYLKPFIIPEPEVMFVPRARSDEFLVLASDGLWDVMSNEEVCNVARKRILLWHKKNVTNPVVKRGEGVDPAAQEAAEYLASLALEKGSKDNVSIIVVDLKSQRKFKSDSIRTSKG